MPNIREFQTPALDLRATETGVEATAAAARRIGSFYNAAGAALQRTGERFGSAIRDAGDAYVRYEDHRQISQGAAEGAGIINGLNQEWNDIAKKADPNDPSVAQKFREERLEPTLEKFKSGFTTERSQQWAEHFTDQYRQHMFLKTSSDMSSMAADAIHMNMLKTGNSLGNAVFNDPSSLDFARDTAKRAIDGVVDSSPTIDAVRGAKAKTDIGFKTEQHLVNSAIQGAIRNGGDWRKIANDPKNAPFINQQENDRYLREENAQKRAERIDETYQKHLEKERRQEVSSAREREYLQKLHSDDPKERASVTAKGVANDPLLTTPASEHFINIIEKETKPEAVARISNRTAMGMIDDIRSGKITNTDKIYKAYGDGNLNRTDLNFLLKEFNDRKTDTGLALSKDRDEFFKKFSPSIDIGKNEQGMASALGQQRILQAEQDARRQEEVLRRAGKDPHLIYDSRSEYFFGRPENLRKYQPTLKQIQDYEAGVRKGGANLPAGPTFEPFIRSEERPGTFGQRFFFDAAATVNDLRKVPDPADREVGRSYPTPRGPMKWTGTGWVMPDKDEGPFLDHGAHSGWRDAR